MSFADIRAVIEANARDSLARAGLAPAHVLFDNTAESPPLVPAASLYAIVSINFDQLALDEVGGTWSAELAQGVCQVNAYGPKLAGPDPVEAALLEVLRGWTGLNGRLWDGTGTRVTMRNMEGPRLLAPDERPRAVGVVAAAFTAQVG